MPARHKEIADAALLFAIEHCLSDPAGAIARRYLAEERGISADVLRAHRVGLYRARALAAHLHRCGFDTLNAGGFALVRPAFEGWLAFPWLDAGGALKGMVFRKLPCDVAAQDRLGRPIRYAFCGDRDALPLYGLAEACRAGHRRLVLVEGTIDLLVLRSHGILEAVAANSCQLRVWHVRDLLQRGIEEIVLCLDDDEAGRRGTMRSIEACVAAGLPVRVAAPLGHGVDPDRFVSEQGAAAFRRVIDAAECGLGYAGRKILEVETDIGALAAAARLHAVRPPGAIATDLEARFWPAIAAGLSVGSTVVSAAIASAYADRERERASRGLSPFAVKAKPAEGSPAP